LPSLGGEQGVVEFEQGLPLLDLVVEIDVQPGHCSRDLRADVHQHHRVESAVGRYCLGDLATLDGLQLVALLWRQGGVLMLPVHAASGEGDGE
jgi:hypothetical protein